MNEEWRNFREGNYQVSNMGRVRRSDGRMKTASLSGNGYMIFGHFDHTVRTTILVHRAVMEVFVGVCPSDMEVNHIDGDKQNNVLTNLEYVTSGQNMWHASKNGLTATGDRNSARLYPESRRRGEDHWSRHKPECLARGDKNGSRTKPENLTRGDTCPASKLTSEKVLAIRALGAQGESVKSIAAKFGVTYQNINAIIKGKSWRHLL